MPVAIETRGFPFFGLKKSLNLAVTYKSPYSKV